MGKDCLPQNQTIPVIMANKFNVPRLENVLCPSSETSGWHIFSTADDTSKFCGQDCEYVDVLRRMKHNSEDVAWKQLSAQARSILNSGTTIRGGELLNMTNAESRRNTKINVLTHHELESRGCRPFGPVLTVSMTLA